MPSVFGHVQVLEAAAENVVSWQFFPSFFYSSSKGDHNLKEKSGVCVLLPPLAVGCFSTMSLAVCAASDNLSSSEVLGDGPSRKRT